MIIIIIKALSLFIRYVCIRCQEWGLWLQVMTFTLNIFIFKNGHQRSKTKANAEFTCELTLNY